MPGRMEFGFTFAGGKTAPKRQRSDDEPFRLLLVGDFSGRGWKRAHGGAALPLGRPVALDAAAIDRAFGACGVALLVDGGDGEPAVISFETIEDFHPDRLVARVPALAASLRLRAELASRAPGPDAFAAAEGWLAQQVGLAAGAPVAVPAAAAQAAAASPGGTGAATSESADDAVARLLGRSPQTAVTSGASSSASPATAAAAMRDLIASIVQPHVTPDPGPRRAQLLQAMDEVLAARLRAILSAPDFRAVEGAWRGVERLVRTLDTDTELGVFLLDACRADLLDAVDAPDGNLEASALHRLLAASDRRYALVAIDLQVDRTREDLRLAGALGAVIARHGGALVAGAGPALAGSQTLAGLADPTTWRSPDEGADGALWRALRESPLGRSIELGLPRVLGRLPYGKKTDPIDSFPFEEIAPQAGRAPEARLWSPAPFAIAEMYGAAFRAEGWQMDTPAGQLDLEDLPAHTYDDDGELRLFPPAEVPLGERAGAALVTAGLTAILARRDRGAARILEAGSIATPPCPLQGPWLTSAED